MPLRIFRGAVICVLLLAPLRLVAQSAVSTTLTSFAAGAEPVSSMMQAQDGNLYGVTFSGGADGNGLIYQLTLGGVFTPLYSFTGGAADGGSPAAGLVEGSDGALYGTTTQGGADGLGTVFRFTAAGLTTLHSFDPGVDGNSPYAALTVANDGNLYGILSQGAYDSNTGNYAGGTIFSVNSSGTYQNLYSFPEDESLGSFATARLQQAADGNLWGVTSDGGSNGYGTLFNWSAKHGLAISHDFTLAEGSPVYGLAESGGTLYGVTFPFVAGVGEVFAITLSSQAYTVLYTFTGESDGGLPATALFPGSDGNLYGTTQSGGTNGDGTFFYLSSNGQPETLLNFPAGSLNTFADAALLEGSDTAFYLPVLFDSTPGLAPESMDGAGDVWRLLPQYGSIPPAPVILSANQTSVAQNQFVTLTWSLANAGSLSGQQCYAFSTPASSWTGLKAASGSASVSLTASGSYTFALNCGGVESSIVQVTVTNATTATSTTLSAPTTVQQNQSATLSATVTGAGATPTGSVRFVVDGSYLLKTVTLANGTGGFTASTHGVAVGTYSVQAIYSGDASHAASTSAAVRVSVTAAEQSTTTTLTASPTSVPSGHKVTLTAIVTSASGTPTGSIKLLCGSDLLATVPLKAGVATLAASTSGVSAGTYPVHAVYSGSATDAPSTSPTVNVTVQ
jgi:uncharacterized repeat protein (TIGR03803 family)